jgi:hypothetical protein
MKIEPTGVILVDVCSIQTEKCVARDPAAITAVWTLPGRVQVNVCRPCLEEQVRSGEWEIQGAKIGRRADVAVYSTDKKLLLVVEVKRKPKSNQNMREWATRIHRNLITHSGVPSAPYFLLAVLPGQLYLWKDNDPFSFDKAPDYEIEAEEVLEPYLEQLFLPLENASEYQMGALISSWLKDIVSSNQLTNTSQTWLQDSGLLNTVRDGAIVMQAPIAA